MGTEALYNYTITNFAITDNLAENISVRINYTRAAGGDQNLYVDLIQVNVTYLPPHRPTVWNLTQADDFSTNVTDGDNLTRVDLINATAHWDTTNLLGDAAAQLIEHNGSGAFTNYSIDTASANWTNYTLNLSNITEFPLAGNFSVRLHIQDIYGQVNTTTPTHSFTLLGTANLTNISVATNIRNSTTANVSCTVVDANTSVPLNGYTVNFFVNDTLVLSNTTNTSGVAVLQAYPTNASVPTIANYTCDIDTGFFYTVLDTSNVSQDANLTNVSILNNTNNQSIYNLGENIIWTLLDSQNESFSTVGWNVSVTRFYANTTLNQSKVNIYNQTNDTFTINLTINDFLGIWQVEVYANHSGILKFNTWNFTVSNTITPVFVLPPAASTYSASAAISPIPRIQVQNARGEVLNTTINVSMTCPTGGTFNSTSSYPTLIKTETNYSLNSTDCQAPGSNGATFTLTATANDTLNNTGAGSITLYTSTPASGSPGGGGSNGGSGGVLCNCTAWVDNICGFGECIPAERYQERTCTPSGCNDEWQCIEDPICEAVADFNFTLKTDAIQLVAGTNGKVIGKLVNTGELLLNVSLLIGSECCKVTAPNAVNISVGGEAEFALDVRAQLIDLPGTYEVNVTAAAESKQGVPLVQTQSFVVTITPNELVPGVEDLVQALNQLADMIDWYEQQGVNMDTVKNILVQANNALAAAEASLSGDQVAALQAQLDEARMHLANAMEGVNAKYIELVVRQNLVVIIIILISIVVLTYLLTQIGIPYLRMSREVGRLRKEEEILIQKRKLTERDYFQRKIDEKIFNKTMITTQGEIFKVRGQIKRLQENKELLLRTRKTPGGAKDVVAGHGRSVRHALFTAKLRIKYWFKRRRL
ncbi:MAG: hypothetical protein KKA90_00640 [Nanoarchaeota archaeon]|nr:hypothetical protein [Nanoarchaeota archaeon]